MGQIFGEFPNFQIPRRRRGPMPKYGRQILESLGIAQNHDCGASTDLSGSPAHRTIGISRVGQKT